MPVQIRPRPNKPRVWFDASFNSPGLYYCSLDSYACDSVGVGPTPLDAIKDYFTKIQARGNRLSHPAKTYYLSE